MIALPSIGYGVDLSHHQNPARVPWEQMRGHVDFVICRAAYGAELKDKHVVEHVRRAREIGAKVGLYLFFRPSQAIGTQWDTFREVAGSVGYGEGDIVPALDIEDDPLPTYTKVDPSWSPFCRDLASRMADAYGGVMLYLSAWEWALLGKPDWPLDYPLWVPDYTAAPAPPTPGGAVPTIWQHRVGPFAPLGPGGYNKLHPDIDQDRLIRPLPLIGGVPQPVIPDEERSRIMGLIALTLSNSVQEDLAPNRMRYA